jgi:hypothetical protein
MQFSNKFPHYTELAINAQRRQSRRGPTYPRGSLHFVTLTVELERCIASKAVADLVASICDQERR